MSLRISQYFRKNGVSATVNLHNLKSVKSGVHAMSSWVDFTDDAGNSVAMHVDGRLAEMLADAFDEYENWLSGQEVPTYDDALDAKVSQTVRESQARALK